MPRQPFGSGFLWSVNKAPPMVPVLPNVCKLGFELAAPLPHDADLYSQGVYFRCWTVRR